MQKVGSHLSLQLCDSFTQDWPRSHCLGIQTKEKRNREREKGKREGEKEERKRKKEGEKKGRKGDRETREMSHFERENESKSKVQ